MIKEAYMRTIHITILLILISFGVGYFLGKFITKNNVVIKEVTVTETKYVKIPVTPEQYKECYNSPIHIQATAKDDKVIIRAFDECKEATATAQIGVSQKKSAIAGVIGFGTGILVGIAIIFIL